MDLKQIKELITMMERARIKTMTLKHKGGEELHLEREGEPAPQPAPAFHPTFYVPSAPHKEHEIPARHATQRTHEESPVEKKIEKVGTFITAPLVGTYYSAPSPEDPLFVKEGDRVSENTVVCIIEAMKVMNEVKAGKSGTIAEILVDNASPVEFGTKLFRIV